MWYPNLEEVPGPKDVVAVHEANPGRAHGLRYDLQDLCEAAGVVYRPPHAFRHGHVVHALEHARSPADLKAISQNVMHANLATTDGVYGILQDGEVGARIGRMGGDGAGEADVVAELERLLMRLKNGG
jgi:integrase